ncbi:hypothetical protein [Actinomycetospora lemnae]|uniref:YbaB/EbfC DNA-binding family protein n=1 Tax=Actinomycetospora lemnae TaxID=3019891 RepID=A0ABT5T2J5_9PSEU|nr:hypothetical protein [Actinomycetospora sp. DW7H6]MDD7969234.1 hypothetical protein [Actinomycetospora sp. DW7H6]
MPLEFSEQPDTGLVAVTLTDGDGTVLQTRVVAADEISRIAARARAAVEQSERTGGSGLYVTLDELIDGTSGPA